MHYVKRGFQNLLLEPKHTRTTPLSATDPQRFTLQAVLCHWPALGAEVQQESAAPIHQLLGSLLFSLLY